MRWVQVLGFDAASDAYDTALVGVEVVDTKPQRRPRRR